MCVTPASRAPIESLHSTYHRKSLNIDTAGVQLSQRAVRNTNSVSVAGQRLQVPDCPYPSQPYPEVEGLTAPVASQRSKLVIRNAFGKGSHRRRREAGSLVSTAEVRRVGIPRSRG